MEHYHTVHTAMTFNSGYLNSAEIVWHTCSRSSGIRKRQELVFTVWVVQAMRYMTTSYVFDFVIRLRE